MSLAINPDTVTHVLINDWYTIDPNSFDLDSYEYVDVDESVLHGGGNSGVCATGFTFTTGNGKYRTSGPLTAIKAIRQETP